MNNFGKNLKKNNAHIVNKDELVKQAKEMEQKLLGKGSRFTYGKNKNTT